MKIIRSYSFYFLLFIILYFFLEMICYIVLKKLAPHGIYPSIKLINQNLEAYNKSKNSNLGWLSKLKTKMNMVLEKSKIHHHIIQFVLRFMEIRI